MPQDNKVENFKLSPELKKLSKRYKALAKMSANLKKGMLIQQSKLQLLTRIHYGTERMKTQVLNTMNPKESIIDQPEEGDMDLHIQY